MIKEGKLKFSSRYLNISKLLKLVALYNLEREAVALYKIYIFPYIWILYIRFSTHTIMQPYIVKIHQHLIKLTTTVNHNVLIYPHSIFACRNWILPSIHWKMMETIWGEVPPVPLTFSSSSLYPHLPSKGFSSLYSFLWRRAWQSTPVLLPENPMDRGAWQPIVHGVAKSQTWLSNWAGKRTFLIHCILHPISTSSS